MTPARSNSSKRNSSNGFKPYTRGVTPILVSSPDMLGSKTSSRTNDSLGSPSSKKNRDARKPPVERPGFPTHAQYKQVEAAYIRSLTPRRQGKALISQALFDRIWDVLHEEPDAPEETAQFRFWVRKMFTLSKTHRSTLNPFDDDPPEEVLLHDNLLVAIREQLYDLLCFCHGSTGHGGRDKTCALIRKHYTWVPKDLVSGFIKACPTCIMKKCGGIDSALATQMAEQRAEDASFFRFIASYGSNTDNAASDASPVSPVPTTSSSISWTTVASHGDSDSQEFEEVDAVEIAYREAVQRARIMKASLSGMAGALPQPPAMSREVSLYRGLPNGWQYRHNDYASAHAEFMKNKEMGLYEDGASGDKLLRVPSILPLWGPDRFMEEEYMESNMTTLPVSQQQNSGLPGNNTLQYRLQSSLDDFKEDSQPFGELVDTSLLPLPAGSASHGRSDATSTEADKGSNNANSVSMSLKRAAAPPRLEIDFSTFRNGLREADVTPDSPLLGINWSQAANPSPTRSDSSLSSGGTQLSKFTVPAPMSAATSVSPGSSALRTPEDEFPKGTKEGDQTVTKGEKASVESGVEMELSDGIQQL